MADLKPSKHGRDHCPGGEDPIPCWPTGGGIDSIAYLEFEALTINDSATTNLTGGTVGQEKVKGTALTVDNTTGLITATEDGVYLVSLNVHWLSNFTGYRAAIITGNINQEQQNASWETQAESGNIGTGVATINVTGIFFANFNGAGANDFQASLRQESGVAQDILYADFSVVQLAAIAFP